MRACGWAFSTLGSVPVLLPLTFFMFEVFDPGCLHRLAFLLTSATRSRNLPQSYFYYYYLQYFPAFICSCGPSVCVLGTSIALSHRMNSPVCRNVEADVALRSTAAVFTYCRSRGLFAGISLEGSYLIERKDTNRKCVWPQPFTAFKSSAGLHVCVFLTQVLLQRHPRLRHSERRRGAAAGVFRPLPHPGGIHRGLHGRLDQQKHASQGLPGRCFPRALPSGEGVADFCCVCSFQSSGPPSRPPAPPPQRASASSQPPAASGDRGAC